MKEIEQLADVSSNGASADTTAEMNQAALNTAALNEVALSSGLHASAPVSEVDIAEYLKKYPQFFERHADLLTMIHLPSPHGTGAISLAERQQLAQRDKIRVLDAKLAEILQFGRENDATLSKMHRLSLGLLAATEFSILVKLLEHNLQEDFDVPFVKLHLWATLKSADHSANTPYFAPVDGSFMQWVETLNNPYCGKKTPANYSVEQANSYAVLPLKTSAVIGVLVLASSDEDKFYDGMGTLYIKRIGELVSAALLPYLN